MVPKFNTRAQQRLCKWAKEQALGPSELARLLGAIPSQVSRWLAGESRPEPPFRILIAELTGISEHSWLTTAEQKVVLRGRRIRLSEGK
jgi:transcriptional regulator with XRE-family HTH domain